jgi:L-seryl-tRNA(Ser) seleniumtransferase
LPVERLPSAALVMRIGTKRSGKMLLQLEAAFRALPRAVIGYVRNDAYHLDLRCLEAGEEARFVTQLAEFRLTP